MPDDLTYKIIVNPTPGRGNGARSVPQIEAFLCSHALDFEIAPTGRPWHAIALVEQATLDGFDVIVAAGGDGSKKVLTHGTLS